MPLVEVYGIARGNEPLLNNPEDVMVGEHVLTGFFQCFPSIDELLGSDALLLLCAGYASEERLRGFAVEVEFDEVLFPLPDEAEGFYAPPRTVYWDIELRTWLQTIEHDVRYRNRARALLVRIANSFSGVPSENDDDDEDLALEFAEDPLAEPVDRIDLWTVARNDDDIVRATQRLRCEGRNLPPGFRPAYMTVEELIHGELLFGLAATFADGAAPNVIHFETREDQIYFPEDPTEDDPNVVFARPHHILECHEITGWLATVRTIDSARIDEMVELIAAERAAARP